MWDCGGKQQAANNRLPGHWCQQPRTRERWWGTSFSRWYRSYECCRSWILSTGLKLKVWKYEVTMTPKCNLYDVLSLSFNAVSLKDAWNMRPKQQIARKILCKQKLEIKASLSSSLFLYQIHILDCIRNQSLIIFFLCTVIEHSIYNEVPRRPCPPPRRCHGWCGRRQALWNSHSP